MLEDRRDHIRLTGKDQSRCLRAAGVVAGCIPGCQRNGCLDTAFTGNTQGTATAHRPANDAQTIGVDHAANRAGAAAVLAYQVIQCVVDLTRTARRLIKAGVGINSHDHETIGRQFRAPPVNRRLGRNKAGNYNDRTHGASGACRIVNGAATKAADQAGDTAGTDAVLTAIGFEEADGRIRTALIGGTTARITRIGRCRVVGQGRHREQQRASATEGKNAFLVKWHEV